MRGIGFFAIIFTIPTLKINGALTDSGILDRPPFIDKDFTDYQEDNTKNETEFLDEAINSLEHLELSFKRNGYSNPKEAKTLINTSRKVRFSDKASNSQESVKIVIEKLNLNKKQKAFLKAKKGTSFLVLASIEEKDVNSVFRRNDKLNPEKPKPEVNFSNKPQKSLDFLLKKNEKLNSKKAKAFLRPKREAGFVPLSSIEDIKSIFKRVKKSEKAISLIRAKREVNVSVKASTSIKDGDIEVKSPRVEKQDSKDAKTLLKTKRETNSDKTITSQIEKDPELAFDIKVHLYNNSIGEKVLRKTKREASFLNTDSSLVEEDNIEKIGKKEKLNRKEEKSAKRYAAAAKLKHDNKVQEIMNFMENNYMTTNYIYDEVQRIQRQGKVQDKLRLLISYLEQGNLIKLKESVLNCFYTMRKEDRPIIDLWKKPKTNNLVINTLKDPYNHGYVN